MRDHVRLALRCDKRPSTTFQPLDRDVVDWMEKKTSQCIAVTLTAIRDAGRFGDMLSPRCSRALAYCIYGDELVS
jgi:hypothetical protein